MFPYDPVLAATVQATPQSVADVIRILETIAATCSDSDGLKWFNWLYLQVTHAVKSRIDSGGFADPAWLAQLDVQFAQLYFGALASALDGKPYAGCWRALFDSRDRNPVGRIQFALAGINAHINHDLPQAILVTCRLTATPPRHGTPHYNDYTNLDATLDSLIEVAKRELHVRLLGDPLPPVSSLEDTIGAWSIFSAREAAWKNSELLWHLRDVPPLSSNLMDALDGLATVAGKALLAPVP